MTETDLAPPGAPQEGAVFRLMGEILAEMPAIGKNQRNTEQNFMFRGYDDVLNALNPIMSGKGVFVVPDVLERVTAHRATRSGGTMYEVNLHVRFTFYGPDGSSVSASGWGEGTDMGDKATNKAMTNAFKYVLFQTFAISTQEASETDSDRYTPEESNQDVLYCRVCSAAIDGARSDREVMRAHLIEEHNWVRVNVGTPNEGVITPERAAQLEAERGAGGDTPAAEAPAPTAAPSTVGTTPGDNAEAADDAATDDDLDTSWVDALKGRELVDTAKEWGVSAAGKVDEIRDRIREAFIADRSAEPAPDAADDAAPEEPDATTDEQGTLDDAAAPEPDAPADDTPADEAAADGPDDGGFQCPDCDEPPFPTEPEYEDHWNAAHGEPDGEPENDGTTDDTAALVAQVKTRIADLKGEAARAYGKYRRDAKLPRPDDMDADQARGLIEFLDGLSA